MDNEYVIINKTEILNRIEELEEVNEFFKQAKTHNPTMAACEATLSTLKHTLSQSTPLIPEIEKAFEAGIDAKLLSVAKINCTVEDYISNLKLDI
jgi:hypothetical protein